jgi:hypothetical protein
MSNPFDISQPSGTIRPGVTYGRFLNAFRRQYGITDPHRYYIVFRRRLLDRAMRDPLGITRHQTLDEWWEAKLLESKYSDLVNRGQ